MEGCRESGLLSSHGHVGGASQPATKVGLHLLSCLGRAVADGGSHPQRTKKLNKLLQLIEAAVLAIGDAWGGGEGREK